MKLFVFGDFFYDLNGTAEDLTEIGRRIREKNARVIVNLEGPITPDGGKGILKRGIRLNQGRDSIEALKCLNVSGVTLANNHIFDYGEKGLFDTIESLDKEGIKHCGAGKNLKEAIRPMVFTEDKEKAAVFSFGWGIEETVYAGNNRPGSAPRENGIVLDTLREYASSHPDEKILVIMHWGFEKNSYPLPYDIDLARKILSIKNVISLIGHHSHCPQPFEVYKGKSVYYSLGNFYFGSKRKNYRGDTEQYGIGVLLDTESLETEHYILEYDLNSDRSFFSDRDDVLSLLPDMDCFSKEYEELVKRTARKKNPVPGAESLKNRLKLLTYNARRNMKRYLGV